MKVFKHRLNTYVILLVSLLTNILFVSTLYKYESKSHLLLHKLENKGYVKKEIQDFTDRPDYWSIRGWNTTIQKLDYQCDVLFFGHSQIEMSDFRKYYPNVRIITSGYPGDNVVGMRMRVAQIEALKPSKIFLMCGVNSLDFSDEDFMIKYDMLVKDIKNASPSSELFIFNILPESDGKLGNMSNNSKIVERNEFIKRYTKQNNIQMIDLYSIYADENGILYKDVTTDGVHLNPQGYDRWAEAIKPYM